MFWNHLDISFPLSTGILFQIQIWFEVANFDKSTMQVDNFEPIFSAFPCPNGKAFPPTITRVLSETPKIFEYSNISHYLNIRIMVSKKTNIIRYSYLSNFDFRRLFIIHIRPIFIIRCNTGLKISQSHIPILSGYIIIHWCFPFCFSPK